MVLFSILHHQFAQDLRGVGHIDMDAHGATSGPCTIRTHRVHRDASIMVQHYPVLFTWVSLIAHGASIAMGVAVMVLWGRGVGSAP